MQAEMASREEAEGETSSSLHLHCPVVRSSGASSPLLLHEFFAISPECMPPRSRDSSSSGVCTGTPSEDEEQDTRPHLLQPATMQGASVREVVERLDGEMKASASPLARQQQQEQQPQREQSTYSECTGDCAALDEVVPLCISSLCEENAHCCSMPDPPSLPPGKQPQQQLSPGKQQQQQQQQQQQRQPAQPVPQSDSDIALRWECRVVTPCIGIGFDFFSAEGCGMVICDQPFSLFNNCCTVELPSPYIIGGNNGSSAMSARRLMTPRAASPTAPYSAGKLARLGPTPVSAFEEGGPDEDYLGDKYETPETTADTSVKPLRLFVATW